MSNRDTPYLSPALRTEEGMKRFRYCIEQMKNRPCTSAEISEEVYGQPKRLGGLMHRTRVLAKLYPDTPDGQLAGMCARLYEKVTCSGGMKRLLTKAEAAKLQVVLMGKKERG